jgi:hypothetical protein
MCSKDQEHDSILQAREHCWIAGFTLLIVAKSTQLSFSIYLAVKYGKKMFDS